MASTAGPEICQSFETALGYEWLETNGRGGYASSTILGANTRRYHGLFAPALDPPRHRMLYVNKVEELCYCGNTEFALSTNQYPGAVFPPGYVFLERFRRHLVPEWHYNFDGAALRKRFFLVHGRDIGVLTYSFGQGRTVSRLSTRILANIRDIHTILTQEDLLPPKLLVEGDRLVLTSEGAPPLYVYHNFSRVDSERFWYNRMIYRKDERRGFDYHEDVCSPCSLIWDLVEEPRDLYIVFSLEELPDLDVAAFERDEIRRRRWSRVERTKSYFDAIQRVIGRTPGDFIPVDIQKDIPTLIESADHFLVTSKSGDAEIMAGYPWLGAWGRDTFLAFKGLLLLPGLFETARNVIRCYGRYLRDGLIPTVLPDLSHEPIYRAADTSLWFVQAIGKYWLQREERDLLAREHFPLVQGILDAFANNETGVVSLGPDGLLVVEDFETDPEITYGRSREHCTRSGKLVDLNALWHNALRWGALLAEALERDEDRQRWTSLAEITRKSFREQFLLPGGTLADIVTDDGVDEAQRPLQLLAASLPFPILRREEARTVWRHCREHLLTAYGLRSLNRDHEHYAARFSGNHFEQQAAYFNGTVWPWMLGAYVDAGLYAHRGQDGLVPRALVEELEEASRALRGSLNEQGVGNIREVFDGDMPHAPHGCIALARTVGELLRCCHRLAIERERLQ